MILIPNKNTVQIVGYPKYAISTEGDVYSCFKGDWKILKTYKDTHAYSSVRLFTESKKGKMFKVHRLVAETYLGNGKGLQVDHIDNNKENNTLKNLRWITQKENLLKKYNEDGHKVHFAKKVAQKTLKNKIIKLYASGLDAAKTCKLDQSSILKVCRGLLKQSGGYKWEYVK